MSASNTYIVCKVQQGADALGFLVIDSMVAGRSHGGIRMREDITEEEICLLARTMTRKYRFLNLPFGGAKAGVIGHPDADVSERLTRLTAFGAAIRPILANEIFVPAGDMGTDIADIRQVLMNIGINLGRRRLPAVSSGEYTAHSVFVGLKALVEAGDSAMRGLRIAIEGFGDVGSHLALLLADTGANVVAVSTSEGAVFSNEGLDIPRLLELRNRYANECVNRYAGAERIPREDLLALKVDALCPCANIHTIHAGNIDSLNARHLCPGANNPWPEELQQSFGERQIQYLPDYVANSGGVLGTTMAYLGFSHPAIVQFIHVELGGLYNYLLQEARSGGRTIADVAAEFLLQRSAGVEGTGGGFSKLILRMGMNFHRRGLVPRFVTRMFARRYLRGRIRTGLPAEIA